jgi:hypothetical protein
MKMTTLGLLAMMISTSTMASSYTDFEDVTGEYEVIYETGLIFKSEKKFTVRFSQRQGIKPGDILFESEELGTCDNINNLGGRADYGYKSYNTEEALSKLEGVDELTDTQSTIFCDSGLYYLNIETERFALENAAVGEKVKAGFLLKDADRETLLNKKATVEKLR